MLADIGEQGAAGTLGEAGVPVAHRHHLQAAVVLEGLDHGPEGVDVGDNGPVGLRDLAPGRLARMAPRRVSSKDTPRRSSSSHTRCTTRSV